MWFQVENAYSLVLYYLRQSAPPSPPQHSIASTDCASKLSILFGSELCQPPTVDIEIQTELLAYHSQPPLHLVSADGNSTTDILIWWKNEQSKYPRLSKLARRFLSAMSTSVPCERAFSTSGWIVNKRRTSLTGSHVSDLSFISCNSHVLDVE